MAVRIQLFAAFSEFAGTREMELPFTPGLRCEDVWVHLRAAYPRLKPMRALFARNDEYIHSETELQDRDVLMIFPPVSGG